MEEEISQMKDIGQNIKAMSSVQTSLQEEINKVGQEIKQSGQNLTDRTQVPASQDLSAWTTKQNGRDLSPWTTAPGSVTAPAISADPDPTTDPAGSPDTPEDHTA